MNKINFNKRSLDKFTLEDIREAYSQGVKDRLKYKNINLMEDLKDRYIGRLLNKTSD